MRKKQKSVSKLLGIWSFLFLLLLKEAFPNAALAISTVDKCATDPACASVIRGSSRPAVAAAIANRNDEIGILVVPTGTFISLHRWSQGTTARAQIKAKEKYCAAYPDDYVCVPFEGGQGEGVEYYLRITIVRPNRPLYEETAAVRGRITYIRIYRNPSNYVQYLQIGTTTPPGVGRNIGQQNEIWSIGKVIITRFNGQPDTSGNPPPLPWKDWSQQKRNIAVDLLSDSDWQGLITSMPATPILRPGDPINIPTILIPG